MITLEFVDFEDMLGFARKLTRTAPAKPVHTEATPTPAPEAEKTKAPKTKEMNQAVEEKKQTAPMEKPEVSNESEQGEPDLADSARYSLEDVRARLAGLSKAGKRSEVKHLLASFGVEKLPEIPEEKYVELMEKAGAL